MCKPANPAFTMSKGQGSGIGIQTTPELIQAVFIFPSNGFCAVRGLAFAGPSTLADASFDVAAFAPSRACQAVACGAGEGWWSRSGSNRRPHACKARALPTELRPPFGKQKSEHSDQNDLLPIPVVCIPHSASRSEDWWAWEDLNFRPHAYQARALTS